MKKLIYTFLFFFCFPIFVYSQANKVTYQYTTSYSIKTIHLFYNGEESLFTEGGFNKESDEKFKVEDSNYSKMKVSINNSDSIGDYQYIKNGKIQERRLAGETYYMVVEDFTPLNWQLIDSTQKIGNYICQLASTFCYGRTFYAWYTSEIPSDKAPWKLGGLPGLVLHAYDSEKKYEWKATNIEFGVEFDFSRYPSEKEQKITLKEYINIEDENYKKMVRKAEDIAAQFGATAEFKEKGFTFIEKEPKR